MPDHTQQSHPSHLPYALGKRHPRFAASLIRSGRLGRAARAFHAKQDRRPRDRDAA